MPLVILIGPPKTDRHKYGGYGILTLESLAHEARLISLTKILGVSETVLDQQ